MDTTSYPRILTSPKGSFFVFGPRGSGKSTWIRSAFPRAHRVDLLDEALYQSYLADIGAFAAELRVLPPGSVVVVDEVQRLPALLNEVHRHIEDRRLRFVLCGSSARKLKTAGTNLLAGRAVRRSLHPFLPEELGKDFDLDEALRYGTLPVIWTAPDRGEALTAYAQLYLKEEIQAEALVRNLPGFARFLPVAALFHGEVINVSGISRDAGAARTTVDASRSGQGGKSSMQTCAAFAPLRTCRTSCAASSSAAATAARRRRMGSTSCPSRPSWPSWRSSRSSLSQLEEQSLFP
jgi:predicted AAA+ superfamily ATPase